jgi:hypothetical protein
LADKSTQLILDALTRAVAEPAGSALHAGRKTAGLFPSTAAGRQLGQHCKERGLLRVVRSESRARTVQEFCTITEKGLAFVLEQTSPRQVLEDLVGILGSRRGEIENLVAAARQWQANLEGLQTIVSRVLERLQRPPDADRAPGAGLALNGSGEWKQQIEEYLRHQRVSGAATDCPLPQLYQQARQASPELTIGRFHDGLRLLHEQERVYLHPWTGPLYEMPEPACALLVGHEIAYYASARDHRPETGRPRSEARPGLLVPTADLRPPTSDL